MGAVEITHPSPGIACFPIELPNNPLRSLNCYVILGERKNLLIDCGFRLPACQKALFAGMQALGLNPENTDVFFTHAHADHTGNARELQDRGFRLLIGRIDLETLRQNDWEARKRRALEEGMPAETLEEVFRRNPAVRLASPPFDANPVEAGDLLEYGDCRFRALLCPGHTPGHLCLYDEHRAVMLTGDHVLFELSPNINSRGPGTDALGDYLVSLRALRPLIVELALPSHRGTGGISFQQRIDELLSHHARRLEEAERLVRESPGSTAYEITGQMTWKIRAESWEAFPPGQKWFAVSEALAHLDHLTRQKRCVRSAGSDGIVRYFPGP